MPASSILTHADESLAGTAVEAAVALAPASAMIFVLALARTLPLLLSMVINGLRAAELPPADVTAVFACEPKPLASINMDSRDRETGRAGSTLFLLTLALTLPLLLSMVISGLRAAELPAATVTAVFACEPVQLPPFACQHVAFWESVMSASASAASTPRKYLHPPSVR